MKKFLAGILALIYFTATSGAVFNVHYCMGHVASVKVDNFSFKAGTCGNNQSKSDCCSDEIKVLKVDNSHKASIAAYNISTPAPKLPSYASLIDQSQLISQLTDLPVVHGPPDISSPHVYLLNCVFRI